jgi:3D (Asp-Asp-Asp) domain-containing protein
MAIIGLVMSSCTVNECYINDPVKTPVRVTAYWRNSDHWTRNGKTSTGAKLKNMRTAAVDPKVFPYRSEMTLHSNPPLKLVAEDTGSAVKSRKASRKTGGQPIVDVFFEKKSQAEKFIKNNPAVMLVSLQNKYE